MGPPAGRKACTAHRRVMLSVKKSRQKNFGAEFVSAFGGAEILQGAKPVRLPGEGLLFYEEKYPKVIQGSALKTRRVGTPRIIGAPARS